MPKVVFNNGSKGVTYGKKRKRYPGTNSVIKNEVKQYNCVYGANASYDAISLSNITAPSSQAQGQSYAWIVYELAHPVEGTEPFNRIGNQYFLKYLRFKGYVRHYAFTPMDINWRLVLYRCDSVTLTGWSGLYKNTEQLPATNVTGQVINTYCRHNYYKKVWDTKYSDTIKKKVIASGCLPRHPYFEVHGQQYAAGSTSSYGKTDQWFHGFNGRQDSIMPIDVKVTCNDWIHVDKIKYYICLEVDCGSAFGDMGYGNMSALRGSNDSEQPLDLSFFIRGYFTDP